MPNKLVVCDPGKIAETAKEAESDPDLRDPIKETPIDLEIPDFGKKPGESKI